LPAPTRTLTVFVPTGHITDADIASGLDSGTQVSIAFPDVQTNDPDSIKQGGLGLFNFFSLFTEDAWEARDGANFTVDPTLGGRAYERLKYLQDLGTLSAAEADQLKFLEAYFAYEASEQIRAQGPDEPPPRVTQRVQDGIGGDHIASQRDRI